MSKKWPAESDTDTLSRGLPKQINDVNRMITGGWGMIPLEEMIIQRTRGFFRHRCIRPAFGFGIDWTVRAVHISFAFWTLGYGW